MGALTKDRQVGANQHVDVLKLPQGLPGKLTVLGLHWGNGNNKISKQQLHYTCTCNKQQTATMSSQVESLCFVAATVYSYKTDPSHLMKLDF